MPSKLAFVRQRVIRGDGTALAIFRARAFEVVHSGPASLPSDQQAILPKELYEWVRTHTPTSADSVFLGGNGFRDIGVIKALEGALELPADVAF